MPPAKDYTHTYQWRFVKAITKKFAEWNFNDDTCKRFIDIAVDHAKELGVLRKGLAVLHQHNMMEICYKKLKLDGERDQFLIQRLVDTCKFLRSLQVKNYKIFFLRRTHDKALSNITSLYLAKKLPIEFMAIYRDSIEALSTIELVDTDERRLLPSDASLYLCRKRILARHGDSEEVRMIVRGDI
jgi:hypothetical protein